MDGSLSPVGGSAVRDRLAGRYREVRSATLALTSGLSAEDQQVQSMDDVSPAKWHLAHTTWFFETFLLKPHLPAYRPIDDRYGFLFNSYYEAVGPRHPRPSRGLLTRPSLDEVHAYRAHVDAAMEALIAWSGEDLLELTTLGLHHEQQHQELILMDIKHVLSCNPLRPAYASAPAFPAGIAAPLGWISCEPGLVEIGAAGGAFAFDNEGPRHKVWLEPFLIADRLATCGEWRAFIDDGGYDRAELWLSDGWATARAEGWRAPLYWRQEEGDWRIFTLAGERALDPAEPVCHLSYYEADAFARWHGARLPTEAEWEFAAATLGAPADGALSLHPAAAADASGLKQLAGQVWQWTASAYAAYPGYRPQAGAIGEYNGKFMSGQMVLRGGACVTPPGHSRITYRNFFPPAARWAFSGVRLAHDH